MPQRQALPTIVLLAAWLLAAGAHAQDKAPTPPAQAQGATAGAPAAKAPATALSRDSQSALRKLYAQVPGARTFGEQATAVLVFPKIRKAGFVVGGQYGEGTLFKAGKPVGYYSTTGLSYGLQAGAQQFGYALFFMNDDAVSELDRADGFEVGVGPSVVVVDQGMAKNVTTMTMHGDIYAFVFSQKGLMAGLGLQGNKVKRITAK
jgi:lipid-binding SYLF domain-containing protein